MATRLPTSDEINVFDPILREGILKMLENFERYGFGGEVYGDAYGDVAGRYRVLLSRLDG
ncbi:hypothetical protein [Singulisphaera acidiphila]|nr:hypothetical protein [Singulisphaera acidiphila]